MQILRRTVRMANQHSLHSASQKDCAPRGPVDKGPVHLWFGKYSFPCPAFRESQCITTYERL